MKGLNIAILESYVNFEDHFLTSLVDICSYFWVEVLSANTVLNLSLALINSEKRFPPKIWYKNYHILKLKNQITKMQFWIC